MRIIALYTMAGEFVANVMIPTFAINADTITVIAWGTRVFLFHVQEDQWREGIMVAALSQQDRTA